MRWWGCRNPCPSTCVGTAPLRVGAAQVLTFKTPLPAFFYEDPTIVGVTANAASTTFSACRLGPRFGFPGFQPM